MAIRRCPYCKAIIDEGSEYCSNCGTQLLFPEDEYIEEEIPGEEIIDEDIKEEETEPTEEMESSEGVTSSGRRKRKKKEKAEEEITEEEIAGDIEELSGLEERAGQEEEQIPEEPKFRTEDLEKIVDSEEKEKAEIEKFLRSLKEDREEWGGEIPPTDEFPPWAEKIKEEEKKADLVEQNESYPAEDELLVEEGEPEEMIHEDIPEEEVPQEDIRVEEPSEEEVSMPDTGMGLPEGLEQESLPFEAKPAEVYEEEEKKPPSRLSMWLKSRAFDVLFIAAIWIVTLHIASRMMSTNLFRLISVSALPVFALYLVLLAVYLFLFFFFLGQTLGDHLFSQEE